MSGEPGTHPTNPIPPVSGNMEDCVSVYRGGRWYAEKPRVDMAEGSEPGLVKPILISFTGNILALAAYWLVTQ